MCREYNKSLNASKNFIIVRLNELCLPLTLKIFNNSTNLPNLTQSYGQYALVPRGMTGPASGCVKTNFGSESVFELLKKKKQTNIWPKYPDPKPQRGSLDLREVISATNLPSLPLFKLQFVLIFPTYIWCVTLSFVTQIDKFDIFRPLESMRTYMLRFPLCTGTSKFTGPWKDWSATGWNLTPWNPVVKGWTGTNKFHLPDIRSKHSFPGV